MASSEEWETTDVVIVGCGPTGALLTVLLGDFGISNIVLEKQSGIAEDPRGITLDEDGVRFLQGVGLYDKVFTDIGSSLGMVNFITSKTSLFERPFLRFDMDTTEGGTGHVGIISQRQPILEHYLRTVAANQKCSQLRSSSTVTQIEEDENWVYCQYADVSGAVKKIRTKFLVGADGKTGFTRKMYLEPKGVLMEQISEFGYKETWVALNLKLTPPTPETHPKLPFWDLGYTPEEVYDLYFPIGFRFICNVDRPAVCGRFGNGKERLWRFEFVVKREEDSMLMASDEKTMEIILPYLTHPGAQYKSDSEIQFPRDCIEILRSRPFTFSARSCNKWFVGRVMLAGDAAHVFPPFGGQGIASGFRDSSALAWRLAVAVRENTKNYEHLLFGWFKERQQQLQESLAKTIANGKLCTDSNTWKFAAMKLLFHIMQLIPPLNRLLEKGPRAEGLIRYKWEEGLPFLGDKHGGICLPQVYCAPVSPVPGDTGVFFTDDVIFERTKKGMFQLVVLLENLSELDSVRENLSDLSRLSGNYVRGDEATFILQKTEAGSPPTSVGKDVFRLATASEFASTESLCKGRPAPLYYDMHQMSNDLQRKRFAIVRPDRFVYAACDTTEELKTICGSIQRTLGVL